ncbi:threonine-phosphate decarboxylase CobD [Furfurilactobacillus siliginis]|uniref:threonine-phosphate decarboxylase n=1 Tax=Furfurilactobacillus siliginis TaxID=348151 RepID=A0A0R2LCU4_9LACO|nr:threonine-phosphate decarboxylase CobD [Furfurilactobacillus siliginis]KRN96180.1 threonine-phosphate decarboxylase [Furfurilactobacillus siliginis]GEK27895.1 threonine-phosphate decarboxylase [Furfurilactobacillus siliginis]
MRTARHGGNLREVSDALKVDPNTFLDFSANINPNGVPTSLNSVVEQGIAQLNRYPDESYKTLREALARQFSVTSEMVSVGNGAVAILRDVALALKAKQAVVVEPAFSEYRRSFSIFGTEVLSYQLSESNDFCLDVSRLINWLKKNATEAQVICVGNPNNPTGKLTSPEDLSELLSYCKATQKWLVIDEAFMDFVVNDSASMIPRMKENDPLIVIRSATKFFAIPGLRLGFSITNNHDLSEKLKRVEETWSVNTFAENFGKKMYEDTAYIEKTTSWLANESAYLKTSLERVPNVQVFSSAANFYLFKANDSNLRNQLWQDGIMIRRCEDFVGLSEYYYRVAVKYHQSNVKLIQALTQRLTN